MRTFNNLKTVQFQEKLKESAIKIYKKIFNNCEVQDLRENGVNVHILDKEFGIDKLLSFKTGQWISIQEKYRKYDFLVNSNYQIKPPWPDFTQEYKNAVGTINENNGEWFKLGAQLYFYGWANKEENNFKRWIIIDIAKYKLIVEEYGGLDKIGTMKYNHVHGKASFYCFPIDLIKDAWLFNGSEI